MRNVRRKNEIPGWDGLGDELFNHWVDGFVMDRMKVVNVAFDLDTFTFRKDDIAWKPLEAVGPVICFARAALTEPVCLFA
jgi:hypothetical protein